MHETINLDLFRVPPPRPAAQPRRHRMRGCRHCERYQLVPYDVSSTVRYTLDDPAVYFNAMRAFGTQSYAAAPELGASRTELSGLIPALEKAIYRMKPADRGPYLGLLDFFRYEGRAGFSVRKELT